MKNDIAKSILKKHEEIYQILKSFTHPIRIKILCQLLLEEEKNVSQLTGFCQISQSAMSQFLSRMKMEGILTSRRERTNVYYKIHDPKSIKLIRAIKEIYC